MMKRVGEVGSGGLERLQVALSISFGAMQVTQFVHKVFYPAPIIQMFLGGAF